MRRSRGARLALALASVVLATGVLAACGDDDDDSATAATSTTAAAKPTELAATAIDYSFTGAPSSIPAGVVDVNVKNGGKEAHQLVFAKLSDGKTIDDFKSVASSETGDVASVATIYGGLSSSVPGGGGKATVVLPKGDYVMFCAIPAADGQPHLAKGMLAALTVTAGNDSAELPDADETITGKDFSFDVPDGFTGSSTVRFVNGSEKQIHELVIFKLADGKTGNDVLAFFGPSAPPGPPPFTDATGAGSIRPGGEEVVETALTPGKYFLACFEGDPGTHKPHFMLGMVKELTVE